MKILKNPVLGKVLVALVLTTLFVTTFAQDGPIKVNGGRLVEKSVYDVALKDRTGASREDSKPFNTLFSTRDIAQCFFQDLNRVTITWKYEAKPDASCMKDAVIQVETLDGSGLVVGTAYSRVEVKHPNGKGMILPFNNMADTGKRIRITILPEGTKSIVLVTLAITRM